MIVELYGQSNATGEMSEDGILLTGAEVVQEFGSDNTWTKIGNGSARARPTTLDDRTELKRALAKHHADRQLFFRGECGL